jgi:hypothetical protein
VEAHDGAEIDVGEHVAGDDEEAVVELVAGVADRPRGPQGRLLGRIDHAHAELGAVAEVVAYVVAHERDGHDDLLEAVPAQQVDDVLHHRRVGDGHHRLGRVGRERAQASPLAASHDHGLHGISHLTR